MARKEDIYRFIRIGGIVSFIPFILISGPAAGYIAGEYLVSKFGFNSIIILILTSLGLLFSIIETIKIIKKAARLEK